MDARPVAVITGASRGLGEAVAYRAARQGHDLVLVARDPGRLGTVAATCRKDGAAVEIVCADLTHPETPAELLEAAMSRFGKVDGLVNNAGAYRTVSSRRSDHQMWDELIELNLTVPFRMATTFGVAMVEAGSGSIVNIASVFALVGVPATAAYAASKGGLISMTRSLAVEWAKYGVRVNAVAAGHMRTDITDGELETERGKQYVAANIPLARVAEPAEVAPLVCLLLGDDGSFITGSVHVADGGFTAR